jgi:hypothetical protein
LKFMTRNLRQWIARAMVGVLLFAQVAVNAHACPAMGMVPSEAGASIVSDASSAATDSSSAQMDPSAPALCLAHCDHGQQSADHAGAPIVQAALLTTLYTLPPLTESTGRARPLLDQPRPQAASSPPLAILHCCFRI